VSRRTEYTVVGVLAAVAVVLWALIPTYPNYDAYYHLVWGREVIHGITPSFQAYAAPTEHPLYVAICGVLAAIFGEDADRALVLFTILSFLALVWAVLRLGRACFGLWPGVAGAVFVGTSFALLLYAAKAYVDVPFLAVVLWAAVVEAERPARRGSAPDGSTGRLAMSLLAVAGLLRPEAWVLAGLYWLWCGWRRWDLLLLVLVGPVGWGIVDASVTGDALFSLHSTSALADQLGRERGIVHVPGSFVSFLSSTARPPIALAGVVGMVLAVRGVGSARGRRLHVPFALFGAGALTFVGTGIAGLAILPRYLTVPVIALCLFAGFAALGFTQLAPNARGRRTWMRVFGVGVVLGLAFVVVKVSVVDRLVTELRYIRSTHDSLAQLLHDPAVTRDRACGPITFPNYRLVPDTRWMLDLPGDEVGARSDRRHPYGVAIFTVGDKTLHRYGYADGASRTTVVPDPGFTPIARSTQFRAYASCAAPHPTR
jgi:hypothetical protein